MARLNVEAIAGLVGAHSDFHIADIGMRLIGDHRRDACATHGCARTKVTYTITCPIASAPSTPTSF